MENNVEYDRSRRRKIRILVCSESTSQEIWRLLGSFVDVQEPIRGKLLAARQGDLQYRGHSAYAIDE